MTVRELQAAGVREPALCAAYERCRQLNARCGRTYFLATRLLTARQRPAVHALYGFARWADDIVDGIDGVEGGDGGDGGVADHADIIEDDPVEDGDGLGVLGVLDGARHAGAVGGTAGGTEGTRATADRGGPRRHRQARRRRAQELLTLETELHAALRKGHSSHPVITALVDTAARYRIDPGLFSDFLRSMRMDLHITGYRSYPELYGYMHGSAAVIGLQMLPVLGTVTGQQQAAPHAVSLGIAFQLTNFLRDVGEDLDRGRVYLPADRLASFGVDRALLEWCRRRRCTDPRVRAAVKDLCALTRGIYAHAAQGIPMLHPVSRPCVRTALVLYRGILDEIEADDGAVMHRRAAVPVRRRAAVALHGLAGVAAARGRQRVRDGRRLARRPRQRAVP